MRSLFDFARFFFSNTTMRMKMRGEFKVLCSTQVHSIIWFMDFFFPHELVKKPFRHFPYHSNHGSVTKLVTQPSGSPDINRTENIKRFCVEGYSRIRRYVFSSLITRYRRFSAVILAVNIRRDANNCDTCGFCENIQYILII